jgi:hypothetical protein
MVMVIRGGVREGWPKTRKPRTMDMHGMCTRIISSCIQSKDTCIGRGKRRAYY